MQNNISFEDVLSYLQSLKEWMTEDAKKSMQRNLIAGVEDVISYMRVYEFINFLDGLKDFGTIEAFEKEYGIDAES